jgi:hypothetical protein
LPATLSLSASLWFETIENFFLIQRFSCHFFCGNWKRTLEFFWIIFN